MAIPGDKFCRHHDERSPADRPLRTNRTGSEFNVNVIETHEHKGNLKNGKLFGAGVEWQFALKNFCGHAAYLDARAGGLAIARHGDGFHQRYQRRSRLDGASEKVERGHLRFIRWRFWCISSDSDLSRAR